MDILEAAQALSLRDAAHIYVNVGCSIIPVVGKKPAIEWRRYTHQAASQLTVKHWLTSGKMRGIGMVCGAVSGGLVVIDIDSKAACFEFESAFPQLVDTLTIRSGSGRGRHYYYYAAGILPANTWRDGIELRANGSYVVAPPSLHPVSGLAYCVVRAASVRKSDLLNDVRRWIIGRGGGALPPIVPRPQPSAPPTSKSAYGQAALQGECTAVRHAPEGSANATLYRAALKLGSMVASNLLTRIEVEIALESAAEHLSNRDGLTATQRTIQSGLKVGMGSPRPVKS